MGEDFEGISIHWLIAEPDGSKGNCYILSNDFNPLAHRRARHEYGNGMYEALAISIHWLIAEPDTDRLIKHLYVQISIHWLIAEPDPFLERHVVTNNDFNPLAHRRARQQNKPNYIIFFELFC